MFDQEDAENPRMYGRVVKGDYGNPEAPEIWSDSFRKVADQTRLDAHYHLDTRYEFYWPRARRVDRSEW